MAEPEIEGAFEEGAPRLEGGGVSETHLEREGEGRPGRGALGVSPERGALGMRPERGDLDMRPERGALNMRPEMGSLNVRPVKVEACATRLRREGGHLSPALEAVTVV